MQENGFIKYINNKLKTPAVVLVLQAKKYSNVLNDIMFSVLG